MKNIQKKTKLSYFIFTTYSDFSYDNILKIRLLSIIKMFFLFFYQKNIFYLKNLHIFAPLRCSSLAGVVKLVDTPDLGSGASRRGGSSPFTRTIQNLNLFYQNKLRFFYF